MQSPELDRLLEGKGEADRIQIARRIGDRLCRPDPALSDRRAAEVLARQLAGDAIDRVREALSEAVRTAPALPRDIALRIAHDIDSVACPFLRATEVFSDEDWRQIVLTISPGARIAAARRRAMTDSLAVALCGVADSTAARYLIENPATPMSAPVCDALLGRFAGDLQIMDTLALRNDLLTDIAIRLTGIVSTAARRKLEHTYGLGSLSKVLAKDAETDALIALIKTTQPAQIPTAVQSLRKRHKLRPPLLMKALGEDLIEFLEVAIAALAGQDPERVSAVLKVGNQRAVTVLLAKTPIPETLHQPFWDDLQRLRHNLG